jgi:hypothetical protein
MKRLIFEVIKGCDAPPELLLKLRAGASFANYFILSV